SLEDEIAKGRAPGFIKPLVIQRTHEGQQAIFTCLPYGNPFPKIKWLKDGVELQSNEKFTIDSLADGMQQLIIKSCMQKDDGYYRCVASNEYGTSSTKAELIIE
uniref:Ig-like domain-containing protein n=1 Tax=Romanomermis culicivorax TaxID=13658 RepID=A0A915L380_ROMCU